MWIGRHFADNTHVPTGHPKTLISREALRFGSHLAVRAFCVARLPHRGARVPEVRNGAGRAHSQREKG